MFDHKVIKGNKDLIDLLEHALDEAKAGKLEAVVVIGCSGGDGLKTGGHGWAGAHRDDMVFPWARLQSAMDTAHMELLRDGTVDWR